MDRLIEMFSKGSPPPRHLSDTGEHVKTTRDLVTAIAGSEEAATTAVRELHREVTLNRKAKAQ